MVNSVDAIRRLTMSIVQAWWHDGVVFTNKNLYRVPDYLMLRTLPAASLPPPNLGCPVQFDDYYNTAEQAIKNAAHYNDIDSKSGGTVQALEYVVDSTNSFREQEFPESLRNDGCDIQYFHSFKGHPFHRLCILTNNFNYYPPKDVDLVLKDTAILQTEVLASLHVALESLTAWPSHRPLVPEKVHATVLSVVGPYARVLHTHFCGDIPFITCSLRFKISKAAAAKKAVDYAFQHKMPSLPASEFWEAERKEKHREFLKKNNVATDDEDAENERSDLEPID